VQRCETVLARQWSTRRKKEFGKRKLFYLLTPALMGDPDTVGSAAAVFLDEANRQRTSG
jgi:hypothetical protein